MTVQSQSLIRNRCSVPTLNSLRPEAPLCFTADCLTRFGSDSFKSRSRLRWDSDTAALKPKESIRLNYSDLCFVFFVICLSINVHNCLTDWHCLLAWTPLPNISRHGHSLLWSMAAKRMCDVIDQSITCWADQTDSEAPCLSIPVVTRRLLGQQHFPLIILVLEWVCVYSSYLLR